MLFPWSIPFLLQLFVIFILFFPNAAALFLWVCVLIHNFSLPLLALLSWVTTRNLKGQFVGFLKTYHLTLMWGQIFLRYLIQQLHANQIVISVFFGCRASVFLNFDRSGGCSFLLISIFLRVLFIVKMLINSHLKYFNASPFHLIAIV